MLTLEPVYSTAELAIELNMSYNFSEVTEEGATLVPVRAPNFVGLANLGNTCYVNSTLQCLMALPEFGARYGTASGSAFAAAGSSLGLAPQDDLRLQFGKLAHGLHTSRYVEMLQARRKRWLRTDGGRARRLSKAEKERRNERLQGFSTPSSHLWKPVSSCCTGSICRRSMTTSGKQS